MKKIYLLSLLLTVIAFYSFGQKEKKKTAAEVKKELHKHYKKETRKEREKEAEGEGEEGENLYQNTLQLAKEQFERLVDPATKTVPSERLADAYEALLAKEEQPNPTGANALIPNVTFSERGPTNVGGRTRSLMVDPNDPTKKTVWAASVGGGLWKNTNVATNPWVKTNDFFDVMALTTLAYNPSNTLQFYFGTGEGYSNADFQRGNGIWESLDGGNTWNRILSTANNPDFYFVNKIVVAPNGDAYAGTTTGLFKRTGGTGNFVKVATGKAAVDNIAANFSDIEIGLLTGGNYNIYAVATTRYFTGLADGTFFHSSNGGAWIASDFVNLTDITSFEYQTDNAYPGGVFPGVNRVELACNGNTVYALCQQRYLGTAVPDNLDSILALPMLPTSLPAGYNGLGAKCLLQSLDGGVVWTQRVLPANTEVSTAPTNANDFTRSQAWYDMSLQVDPNDPNTVYTGAIDYWKSVTGGNVWIQQTDWQGIKPIPAMHSDHHTMIFEPGSSATAYFGCDGGIYMGTNLNNAVTSDIIAKNTNYNVTQFYSVAARKEAGSPYLIAGAQDNGSQQFNGAGAVPTFAVSGGDGAFCLIDQVNSNNQVSSYVYNNYYRTTTGSANTTFSSVSGGTNDGRFINACDLANGRNVMYSVGNTDSIYRWSNFFGSTTKTVIDMDAINPAANSDRKPTAITASPNVGTTVYVGDSRGRLYRIRNAETTPLVEPIGNPVWESATGGFFYISSVDVFAGTGTDDIMMICASNYGVNSVWTTTNGTAANPTWTSVEGNFPDIPVRWAVFDPRTATAAFLGTELGVFSTDNLAGSSTNWERYTNFPYVQVDMIKVRASDKTLAIATHGRGAWLSSPLTNVILSNDLINFNATRTGNMVDVKWKVEDESNLRMYEVERSYEVMPFAKIGERPAANSAAANYTLVDDKVSFTKGDILYRLKIISKDGSVK